MTSPDAETIAATVRAALESAALRAYFANLPPHEVVGLRGECYDCPLAVVINQAINSAYFSMVSGVIRVMERATYQTVAYIQPFPIPGLLDLIDKSGRRGVGIQAKTMLRILDQLTQEQPS